MVSVERGGGMADDNFEWSDAKAAANAARHGITFDLACRVFDDPAAIWKEDFDSSWEEDRFQVIGQVEGRVAFVCYTYRGETVIRLISARWAVKREIHEYYDSQTRP